MATGPSDARPRPGARVIAACDLPTGCRGHTHVARGTAGEIVQTPAYFSTAYSIRFDVHGTPVTIHRVSRREFRLLDESGLPVEAGFPPADRFPQPAPSGPDS
jgi:hypothetical protein